MSSPLVRIVRQLSEQLQPFDSGATIVGRGAPPVEEAGQENLTFDLVNRKVDDVLGDQAHYIHTFWWQRIVPLRSYVHGWKIGPSHYSNQDLGTIWLSPPECGECTAQPTITKAEAEPGK